MRELDKVIGYEHVKRELYRIIDMFHNPEKYKALGVKIPKGVVLSGEPGIGKTLMAKSFMKESGRKEFIIRKDRPDGDFVEHIRKTFDEAAENAPAILLLDDMDKFANDDRYHRNSEEYVTVQTCIDAIKDKDVFVIATCNDTDNLPGSLLRSGRFDKSFEMEFPKGEDAEKIISFYLEGKMVSDDIDVKEIARFCEGHSCADLETIVNEAGIYAGYDNRERMDQNDLKRSCLRMIYHTPEETVPVDEKLLRLRAVHEAGHAVLAEVEDTGSVSFVTISMNESGQCGGMVLRKESPVLGSTFGGWETKIMVALAGKAATEIVLGEVDMGSNSDLHKAYSFMRRLLDDRAAYDFQSWCHGEETSGRIYDHLDTITGAELSRYYLRTKQILSRNRDFLDELIEQLMEKKTLSYKEIAPLREKLMVAA